MTRLLLTVVLLIVLIVIAYIAITIAAAAIMRLGLGRDQRREFDRDLDNACGFEAGSPKLRELPAPGKDIYTDHTVRLPWTPQAADLAPFPPPPAWTPSTAELDELQERWTAAQPLEDGDHAWCGRDDVLPEPSVADPSPRIMLRDDRDFAEPGDGSAPAEDPFVSALLSLPVDQLDEAFSTGQFPAVIP